MYYAHFILNKKGPLAKIWLAAHWDKKLTKAQIYETNIESTIEAILEPQMKLALRTSGHLLLGVCRIYSRKVKYLLADCNEAFVKIKLAFRPGLIDLPKEKQQASVDAITLPEKFPEFYVNFTDINIEDMDLTKNVTQQARVEDITLKEDFGTFVTMQDDDFGDMGSFGMDMDTFMMSDMERGRKLGESAANNDQSENDFFDDRLNNQSEMAADMPNTSKQNNNQSDLMEINETNDIQAIKMRELDSKLDDMDANKVMEDTLMNDMPDMQDIETNDIGIANGKPSVVPTLFDEQTTVNIGNLDDTAAKTNTANEKPDDEEQLDKEAAAVMGEPGDENNEMTNANKKDAPVAVEKQIRTRRRRKLIIDDVKEIDSTTMKTQLSDTTSILGTLELAPPTRKLMLLKETGGVDKLFSMTGRPIHSRVIAKLYTRNMVTRSLVDITNSMKDKTLTKDASKLEQSAVEADMNDHQSSKHVLPLVDSIIDDNNDLSRLQKMPDQEGNKTTHNDLDELDQYVGPASVYNPNQNLEDMLLDYPPQVTEITPSKGLAGDDEAKESGDEDDEEEEEDEEGTDGLKRASKGKSPQQTKKRSYRKSIANTTNLNNTTVGKDDEENIDDTLTNDPSKNLTKRAKTMVSILNKGFAKNDNVGFFELIKRNGRKSVVQKFYSLLVLKKYEIIDLTQADTYGDIIICQGEKFENFAPN